MLYCGLNSHLHWLQDGVFTDKCCLWIFLVCFVVFFPQDPSDSSGRSFLLFYSSAAEIIWYCRYVRRLLGYTVVGTVRWDHLNVWMFSRPCFNKRCLVFGLVGIRAYEQLGFRAFGIPGKMAAGIAITLQNIGGKVTDAQTQHVLYIYIIYFTLNGFID